MHAFSEKQAKDAGIAVSIIILIVSYFEVRKESDHKAIILSKQLFSTDKLFNILSIVIILILIALYTIFW